MLSDNYDQTLSHIAEACHQAGRKDDEVVLIAVSKTKPLEMLQELYAHGCRTFGENKVQELTSKYEMMPKDVKWHMIGHLQRNKVKYIIGKTELIHSVDSARLAEEISKESQKQGIVTKILIEVNIAGEETKYGVSVKDLMPLIHEVSPMPNISIQGLMAIAPYVINAEENREYFAKLRQLSVDIIHENIDNVDMNVLSMGMTGDYQVAIAEGSTMVRVGTGIFGERNYVLQ